MMMMLMMMMRRKICEKAFWPKWSAIIGIPQYQSNSRPAHNLDFQLVFILIYKQQQSNVFASKPAPQTIEMNTQQYFGRASEASFRPQKCFPQKGEKQHFGNGLSHQSGVGSRQILDGCKHFSILNTHILCTILCSLQIGAQSLHKNVHKFQYA